ncbi:MAG: hypothetical protein SGJ19_25890 [Planctomycetia bacterium]|nr:hypothetical protein [Planctomycetia bacterium]
MRQNLAMLSWFASAIFFIAGCAGAPRSHKAALNAVDEDEIIAAAEKDDFPAANAPAR